MSGTHIEPTLAQRFVARLKIIKDEFMMMWVTHLFAAITFVVGFIFIIQNS